MAVFSVKADAAQQMIDYSGLQVCRFLPGRAIVILILAHFIDGDLGTYHEFSTGVMVNPPGIECDRIPRPAVGGHVHRPDAGRPGVHPPSGSDDLGISEGDG